MLKSALARMVAVALVVAAPLPLEALAQRSAKRSANRPAARAVPATKPVSLADGAVTFGVPSTFTELSKSEIDLKFPRALPPSRVYGNAKRSVTVAVTFMPTEITRERLPDMKTALEEAMVKVMPDLEWVAREMIEIDGRPWVHLALVTQGLDATIRNEIYVTDLDGKALMINLNATLAEYPKAKPIFEATSASLRIAR
jgi:hypothetical protein